MEGKLVRLRPYRETDYGYLASLKNNMYTQGWNQRLPPHYTAERIKKRIEERTSAPNSAALAIETLDGTLIGDIVYNEGLPRFDATFGIVIGREHWGKGLGEEAQELLLEFLFLERGLQVVRLWTQTGFPWAQKAAEKLGFRVGIRFRENTIIDGRVRDSLYMDMLREEYFARRGLKDQVKAP